MHTYQLPTLVPTPATGIHASTHVTCPTTPCAHMPLARLLGCLTLPAVPVSNGCACSHAAGTCTSKEVHMGVLLLLLLYHNYVLCIMYYVLCIMYYVLCIMYYVLCIIIILLLLVLLSYYYMGGWAAQHAATQPQLSTWPKHSKVQHGVVLYYLPSMWHSDRVKLQYSTCIGDKFACSLPVYPCKPPSSPLPPPSQPTCGPSTDSSSSHP